MGPTKDSKIQNSVHTLNWVERPHSNLGEQRQRRVIDGKKINRKFRVATEIGSTIFGCWLIMKVLNDRAPSCLILVIWDFGRIREQATGAGDHGLRAHNNPCAKTFQMSPHLFNLNHRNSSYACKSVFFCKGPGKGQIPGLLGHGPEIPDRTIDHCKATDLCWKFQFSKCYSGWEIGDGRTDRRTTQRFQ
jgi:hypothetical protein